jgi:hypothetical protein
MQQEEPTAPATNGFREWPAVLLAMFIGLLLATLPHAVRWAATGDPIWICDTDELVPYGHIISHSYREHPWRLGDPALVSGGSSMYPWIQFAPWMLLTRLLGLGPLWVFFVMRVVAGMMLGLGFYLLGRRPGMRWAGLILAIIALADHGLTFGVPLLTHWDAVRQIISGTPGGELQAWAGPLKQFRIITPGLSFLSMALALDCLIRLREAPSRMRMAIAGLAFGYCVATYLYFWTTVGGTLGLLLLIDRKNWRWYAGVIAIGMIVGSPAVLQNFITKATYGDEWLVRNEYMVRLERPMHAIPKLQILMLAVLAAWIWKFNRRLSPVWFSAVVAVLLSQSHEITHIYLQPSHWLVAARMLTSILLLHALLDAWTWLTRGKAWGLMAIAILAVAQLAGAVCIRHWATDHNEETARVESNRQRWLRFLRDNPTLHLEPNAVVAGDITVTDWAVMYNGLRPLTGAVGLSPSVNDSQWLRRRTLNAWLKGVPGDRVSTSADGEYGVWFNLAFINQTKRDRELADFKSVWAEYAHDATPDLNRMGVRYLVLSRTASPPPEVLTTWRKIPTQGDWQIWER